MNRWYLELINSGYMKVKNGEVDRVGINTNDGQIIIDKIGNCIRILTYLN